MNTIIVTRHANLFEWLRLHGIIGEVRDSVTSDDVRGKNVIGVLPLDLAAECASYAQVSFPLMTEAQQAVGGNADFSIEQMDEMGATLEYFAIQAAPQPAQADVVCCLYDQWAEWLGAQGITAPRVTFAKPADIAGKRVFGVLPPALATLAASVTLVCLPLIDVAGRKQQASKQFTVADMERWGACLRTFVVREVKE